MENVFERQLERMHTSDIAIARRVNIISYDEILQELKEMDQKEKFLREEEKNMINSKISQTNPRYARRISMDIANIFFIGRTSRAWSY